MRILDLVLRGLGLKTTLAISDLTLLQELVAAQTYQVWPDPSGAAVAGSMLNVYVTTNPQSLTKHNDLKIDEYQRLIDTTIDQASRKKIVWEAEQYIVVDKAYYPARYTEDAVFGYKTYVKGEWVSGYTTTNINDHTTVWLDNTAR